MMWQNFLTWLLKFALDRLGADVDAESEKMLADYELRRAEVEKARGEAESSLDRIENERLTLVAKRVQNSVEIEFLQQQIKTQDEKLRSLNDEKNKKLNDISNLSDDAILHIEL